MPINGLVVMTPTSIASTGTGNSSSINADGSVDFASCATLSLNGVFTSSYDNYMVTMWNSQTVTDVNLQYRLRVSGTDNSTASSYTYQALVASSTTVTGVRTTSNIGTVSFATSTYRNGMTLYLFGPFLTQPTAWRSVNVNSKDDAALYEYAGMHNQSTSYNGFTIIPDNGLATGLLTVFGFNQ